MSRIRDGFLAPIGLILLPFFVLAWVWTKLRKRKEPRGFEVLRRK